MKLAPIALAAALAAGSVGVAHANTYVISATPLVEGTEYSAPTTAIDVNTTKSPKTFTDDFTFTITSTFDTFVTGLYQHGIYNITSATLDLYKGVVGSGTHLAGTGSFNPYTNNTTLEYDSLVPGSYYVEATVTVPAKSKASYNVGVSVVSAAPEPASWLLMIGGVALMGAAFRFGRRFKGEAAFA